MSRLCIFSYIHNCSLYNQKHTPKPCIVFFQGWLQESTYSKNSAKLLQTTDLWPKVALRASTVGDASEKSEMHGLSVCGGNSRDSRNSSLEVWELYPLELTL